jgi:hypothetical protein
MSPSWSSKAALAALALGALAAPAIAQQPQQQYAGLQAREIRALSEEQIADLSAGRGMGLALAAELNGYPGPVHVLELADRLELTDAQRTAIKQQFDAMQSEAVPLGQRLIAAEKELNRQFAERTITPERLRTATALSAEIRGALRNTHLRYHLSTAAVLNTEQIRRYAELRGYAGGGAAPGAHAGPAQHGMPAQGAADNQPHQHMPGMKHAN